MKTFASLVVLLSLVGSAVAVESGGTVLAGAPANPAVAGPAVKIEYPSGSPVMKVAVQQGSSYLPMVYALARIDGKPSIFEQHGGRGAVQVDSLKTGEIVEAGRVGRQYAVIGTGAYSAMRLSWMTGGREVISMGLTVSEFGAYCRKDSGVKSMSDITPSTRIAAPGIDSVQAIVAKMRVSELTGFGGSINTNIVPLSHADAKAAMRASPSERNVDSPSCVLSSHPYTAYYSSEKDAYTKIDPLDKAAITPGGMTRLSDVLFDSSMCKRMAGNSCDQYQDAIRESVEKIKSADSATIDKIAVVFQQHIIGKGLDFAAARKAILDLQKGKGVAYDTSLSGHEPYLRYAYKSNDIPFVPDISYFATAPYQHDPAGFPVTREEALQIENEIRGIVARQNH